MRYYSYIFITCSCFHFIEVIRCSNVSANNNKLVFLPTREWQTVNKGTPIPKGLHVRHNFQTGVTEAKLIDDRDHESDSTDHRTQKSLVIHPDANKFSEIDESETAADESRRYDDNNANISSTELRTKLKTIKSMNKKASSLSSKAEDEEKKFRNFDDVNQDDGIKFKKSMASDDFEYLKLFVQKFDAYRDTVTSGSSTVDEVKIVVDILSQLEYLVHDIDNGLEFARTGGLIQVIYPCLNRSVDAEIKLEALRLLGATVQSNPKVKESVLELDLVQKILKTLTDSSDPKLSDRCLFALGSLVRNCPAAQKVFLDNKGLVVFSKILAEGKISTQKRVINLINDLIIENRESQDNIHRPINNNEILEYEDLEFENRITNDDYKLCENIANLLVEITLREISKNDVETADKDSLETIYRCALTIGKICQHRFEEKRNEILPAIKNITLFLSDFNRLIETVDDDYHVNDWEDILNIAKKLKEIIVDKSFKDEL